jgi:hypothetical protein
VKPLMASVAEAYEDAEAEAGFSKLKAGSEAEIFTKFDNVKSRITWTPERRNQLQMMWDRGDKVPDIAAALGCKVGAVNVARARFGLEPRRIVSGRPKQELDEPAHKIARVAFHTSRLMEFASEKELVAQTGHQSYEWLRVIAKELVDNGIDACEDVEIAPVIKVTITTGKDDKPTRLVVEDNGPGIPPDTITGIIDYNIRVSSREAYISPTRGRQGNALKTILPMSYVVSGKIEGETWIEARGVKHRLVFSVNQIKQEPIVENIRGDSKVSEGTRITIFWPAIAAGTIGIYDITELLLQYIWVNPHLTLEFVVDGETKLDWEGKNPQWTKYRACDATSAHWYTLEQFERYAGALIDHDQRKHQEGSREKITVRDFAAQFRGMSATEKQKKVLIDAPLEAGRVYHMVYFHDEQCAFYSGKSCNCQPTVSRHAEPERS